MTLPQAFVNYHFQTVLYQLLLDAKSVIQDILSQLTVSAIFSLLTAVLLICKILSAFNVLKDMKLSQEVAKKLLSFLTVSKLTSQEYAKTASKAFTHKEQLASQYLLFVQATIK